MSVHRGASRLNDEDVRAANVFLYLKMNFTIGELLYVYRSKLAAQLIANLRRQGRVCIACENLEVVKPHRAYRLGGGHIPSF